MKKVLKKILDVNCMNAEYRVWAGSSGHETCYKIFEKFKLLKGIKITWVANMLVGFCWIHKCCVLVELHHEGLRLQPVLQAYLVTSNAHAVTCAFNDDIWRNNQKYLFVHSIIMLSCHWCYKQYKQIIQEVPRYLPQNRPRHNSYINFVM